MAIMRYFIATIARSSFVALAVYNVMGYSTKALFTAFFIVLALNCDDLAKDA